MLHWEFTACSAKRPLLTHPCVLTPRYSPICLQVSQLWNIICFKRALADSHSNHAPDPVSVIGPRGICHTALDHRAVCCVLCLTWLYAHEKCHPEAFGEQHNLLNMPMQ